MKSNKPDKQKSTLTLLKETQTELTYLPKFYCQLNIEFC